LAATAPPRALPRGNRPCGRTAVCKVLAHERGVVAETVLAHAMQVLAWPRGAGRTVPLRMAKCAFESGSLAWSCRPFLLMPSGKSLKPPSLKRCSAADDAGDGRILQ